MTAYLTLIIYYFICILVVITYYNYLLLIDVEKGFKLLFLSLGCILRSANFLWWLLTAEINDILFRKNENKYEIII